MNDQCFVAQQSSEKILEFVTRYCTECYREFTVGETIYYDMQTYRYLCRDCAEKLSERMDEQCEIVEEEQAGLF